MDGQLTQTEQPVKTTGWMAWPIHIAAALSIAKGGLEIYRSSLEMMPTTIGYAVGYALLPFPFNRVLCD